MRFPNFHNIRGTQHHVKSSTPKKGGDKILLLLILVVSLIGIVLVYDSSVVIAIRDFSDRFYYAKEQIKWLILGTIAFTTFSFIRYKTWYAVAVPLLIGTIGMLIAVFIPGLGVRALGAKRWINLGITVLQPSEFAKLSLIIYLSAWFSSREKERFGSFLLLIGMVVGLIIIQPDLGTSLIIVSVAMLLYFFSGAAITHFFLLVPLLAVAVLLISVVSPYRFARLTSFLDPGKDPLGASYQVKQATLALGSGGVFGLGLGKSRQKYEYLPEANTDSIFAILGEETGFIGTLTVSFLYLCIVYRGFRIASKVEDAFGRLLALGISSWIGIQSMMNIAAIAALIPLTGIPLPLISYGGSNLVVMLSALGILWNISKTVSV